MACNSQAIMHNISDFFLVLSFQNISIVLSNSSGCISTDAGFQLQSGLGTFLGSLCSPIKAVSISFTAETVDGTRIASDSTPQFDVTGMPIRFKNE